jgi:outer membrane lipoprotein-sorting protein
MKSKPTACLLLPLCLTLSAYSNDPTQDMKLRMDQASAKFRGMTADVEYTTYTAVLDEKTAQSGDVVVEKSKRGDVRALLNFVKPDPESVSFDKHIVQVYYPKIKTVNVYDFGKQAEQVEQFIMIGFGTSGTELAKSYDMTVLGPETLSGQQVLRIQLVPRSDDVRKLLTKLELWVPQEGDPYPIQEKAYRPNKDYQLSVYSNLRINPPLAANAVELKLPSGVSRVFPK